MTNQDQQSAVSQPDFGSMVYDALRAYQRGEYDGTSGVIVGRLSLALSALYDNIIAASRRVAVTRQPEQYEKCTHSYIVPDGPQTRLLYCGMERENHHLIKTHEFRAGASPSPRTDEWETVGRTWRAGYDAGVRDAQSLARIAPSPQDQTASPRVSDEPDDDPCVNCGHVDPHTFTRSDMDRETGYSEEGYLCESLGCGCTEPGYPHEDCKHAFAVDAACEHCDVMLSELVREQHQRISFLLTQFDDFKRRAEEAESRIASPIPDVNALAERIASALRTHKLLADGYYGYAVGPMESVIAEVLRKHLSAVSLKDEK